MIFIYKYRFKMKRRMRLTESELQNMIYIATKEVIKEMTANQAALVSGANAAAFRDYITNGTAESESKQNRADLVRLPAITKAVIDKFGHFKLKLQEYNPNSKMGYVNYFIFDCIVLIDDNSCVMKGELSIGGRPYSIGYVRYKFEEDTWHRVRFSASGRVSEIAQLEPFKPDAQIAIDVTIFLQNFLDKESQYRNSAMSQNPIPSKQRKPLSQKARANLYGDYINAYNKKKAVTPTEQL